MITPSGVGAVSFAGGWGSTDDFGAFGFFLTGFLGAAGGGGGVTGAAGCSCSSWRHSGICAEALQDRSFLDSGCLE